MKKTRRVGPRLSDELCSPLSPLPQPGPPAAPPLMPVGGGGDRRRERRDGCRAAAGSAGSSTLPAHAALCAIKAPRCRRREDLIPPRHRDDLCSWRLSVDHGSKSRFSLQITFGMNISFYEASWISWPGLQAAVSFSPTGNQNPRAPRGGGPSRRWSPISLGFFRRNCSWRRRRHRHRRCYWIRVFIQSAFGAVETQGSLYGT